MGLFDGVKDAFSAPALERSSIDSERETPIDRWMGWSVVSENEQQQQQSVQAGKWHSRNWKIHSCCANSILTYVIVLFFLDANFVDSMDESNYLAVELVKPMGIVFEENDAEYGGIFVQSIKEDSNAAKKGALKEGDQLVAVNKEKVSGMAFDDALGTIVDSEGETTKLLLFRGTEKQFYGPTGASQEWLDDFISKGGVPAKSA